MTDQPSRSTLDSVDELWDVVAPHVRRDGERSRSEAPRPARARSPVRTGTNPWDDRTLPLFTAAAGRVAASAPSPTRSGTASLDELLGPAIKRRDEGRAAQAARASSPTRGGTRSWDDLLTELREAGKAEQKLHVSAVDTVFGDAQHDPFEDLPTHLLEWVKPDKPR